VDFQIIIYIGVGLVAGAIAGVLLRKRLVESHEANINAQGKLIIETALSQAEQIKKSP